MKIFEGRESRLKTLLFILVMIAALHGASKEDLSIRKSSSFEVLVIDLVSPIHASIVYVKRAVTSLFDDYFLNISASKENKVLRKEVDKLKNQIFKYEELAKENKRLKNLLGFGTDTSYKRVLAQIVAWDASSDFKVLRINKGLEDGIKIQSPVVTSNGLVGYIVRLTNHFADILTILDSNNHVDAIVTRTRSHGMIEGLSQGKCTMQHVLRVAPLVLNDLVITSGLGNIYPKGIQIGTISKIERESYGTTQYVEVRPSVDFRSLEEIIVLVAHSEADRKKEWQLLDSSEVLEGRNYE